MRQVMNLGLIAMVLLGSLGSAIATAEDKSPATQPALPALNAQEAKFEREMRNVTLAGQFTTDGIDRPARKEKYTIVSIRKITGETWLFNARIQFGSKDVTLPLFLPVQWAGDTPVITVTKMGIPGIGTYTARVLIYDGHYAGMWSGGPTHQGTLSGIIQHAPAATQPAKSQ